MLGELRRDGLAELAAEAAREAHALALDVGAGLLEQRQRLRLPAELDADLLQHRLGIVLDEGEALFREQLVGPALPPDVAVLDQRAAAAQRPPPIGASRHSRPGDRR